MSDWFVGVVLWRARGTEGFLRNSLKCHVLTRSPGHVSGGPALSRSAESTVSGNAVRSSMFCRRWGELFGSSGAPSPLGSSALYRMSCPSRNSLAHRMIGTVGLAGACPQHGIQQSARAPVFSSFFPFSLSSQPLAEALLDTLSHSNDPAAYCWPSIVHSQAIPRLFD